MRGAKLTVFASAAAVFAAVFLSTGDAEAELVVSGYGEALAHYAEIKHDIASGRNLETVASRLADLLAAIEAAEENNEISSREKERLTRLRSQTLELAGRPEEGMLAYKAYLDKVEKRTDAERGAVALRRHADQMKRMLHLDEAYRYYDIFLTRYADHVKVPYVLYQQGMVCMKAGYTRSAEGLFRRVVEDYPDANEAPKSYQQLERALFLQERYDESLAVLQELVNLHPSDHWRAYAWYRKGFTYWRQNEKVEALAAYGRGIEDFPTSPYTWAAKKHVEKLEAEVRTEMAEEVLDGILSRRGCTQVEVEGELAVAGGPETEPIP